MTRKATIDDLKAALSEGSGVTDGVDLDRDINSRSFDELGYDSLAILDAGTRLGREFHVEIDDQILANAVMPIELVDAVNSMLFKEKG